jgi:putative membrane protein
MGWGVKQAAAATWKEAFFASPGPRSTRAALLLGLKGVCMGVADTIPGVSGGTIALITGIYEDLLSAIKSADTAMIRRLLRLDLKAGLAGFHARFLLCLFLGIGIAVFSIARLMHYLLVYHPVLTWSLFFGLIAASILVVGRQVEGWGRPGVWTAFLLGAAAAYAIVNLMPATTPETLGFIFLSGMCAICAMILPGISGAFILVILGKYEFIMATVKNPFLPAHLVILLVFMAGCLVGLAGFSRFLKYLLNTHRNLTLALLTGLMLGAMRKVWPWKETLKSEMIGDQLQVLQTRNVLPPALDGEVFFAAFLVLAGFAAVVLLERISRAR